MASFGNFIKVEREKKGWSQTEFGALVSINTPAVSRIENDKKSFTVAKLELLAHLFELDFNLVRDLFFADKFAKEAYKYNCTSNVFKVAEGTVNYIRDRNKNQGSK